jgi:hypothetical protein
MMSPWLHHNMMEKQKGNHMCAEGTQGGSQSWPHFITPALKRTNLVTGDLTHSLTHSINNIHEGEPP